VHTFSVATHPRQAEAERVRLIEEERNNRAATRIQAVWRGYYQRNLANGKGKKKKGKKGKKGKGGKGKGKKKK